MPLALLIKVPPVRASTWSRLLRFRGARILSLRDCLNRTHQCVENLGRHNIEFSCRPESNYQAPVRWTAFYRNRLLPGGQLQRFVRWTSAAVRPIPSVEFLETLSRGQGYRPACSDGQNRHVLVSLANPNRGWIPRNEKDSNARVLHTCTCSSFARRAIRLSQF